MASNVSFQVKDNLASTKAELTETKQQLEKDQDNSSRAMIEQFGDLSEKIKSEFEMLKHDLAETKRQIEEEKQNVAGRNF